MACTTVAMIGNPTSDKGRGAKAQGQVFRLLADAGAKHGFGVMDLTGGSFDESLANAREHSDRYDCLVVVGGDGMIALGANAVDGTGKPLGIVAIGSGNDFARGLRLPVNRIPVAVEGIVGAIVRGSYLDVDMGHATGPGPAIGGDAIATADGGGTGTGGVPQSGAAPIDRYYGGMLSCGLDASINDRANRSHLPNGSVRYLAAVLVELTHMKRYGYHVTATLADGTVEERDLVTPLLTVANSRHIGGGIEVSPYSRFDDGLLDLVWMDHVPGFAEICRLLPHLYDGRLLASEVFGWERVREVEVTRAAEGDEPPVLMADGEYVGRLPVRVRAVGASLRVLVPPAVAEWHARRTEDDVEAAIVRDGRDPVTGGFRG